MESHTKRNRVETGTPVLSMWERLVRKVLMISFRVTQLVARMVIPLAQLAGPRPVVPGAQSEIMEDLTFSPQTTSSFEWINDEMGKATSATRPAYLDLLMDHDDEIITEEILQLIGPFPKCDHSQRCKIHVTRRQGDNFLKLFWRCPRNRHQQCPFFMWTRVQPLVDRYLIPRRPVMASASSGQAPNTRCQHIRIVRTGSNAFVEIQKCAECGKVLSREPTELGRQKNLEKMQKQTAKHYPIPVPTPEECREWQKKGLLRPGGIWEEP